MPCHRIGWSLGADKLTVVSVGTGSYRVRLNARDLRRGSSVTIALRALVQQISENQQLTLSLMSWMGAGGSRWPINSEIGDLVEAEPPFGAQFRFLRYDAKLEAGESGEGSWGDGAIEEVVFPSGTLAFYAHGVLAWSSF
jgi:hypothetical protein